MPSELGTSFWVWFWIINMKRYGKQLGKSNFLSGKKNNRVINDIQKGRGL